MARPLPKQSASTSHKLLSANKLLSLQPKTKISVEDYGYGTPYSTARTLNFCSTSPISPTVLLSDSITSREKRDFNRQIYASFSSDNGPTIKELTCDEIDDLLPKTDYTYARTATYSPRFLKKTKYISPNMSRRKIHGSSSLLVLSDDEDDSVYGDRNVNQNNLKIAPEQATLSEYKAKPGSKKRTKTIYTSTPKNPRGDHLISVHDHYYDGMVLRSGSHIKGQRFLKDKHGRLEKETSSHIDLDKIEQNKLLKYSFDQATTSKGAAKTRSYNDFENSRHDRRLSSQNHRSDHVTTTTVTTTTIDKIADEPNENKLRLDQQETEKGQHRHGGEYSRLQTLTTEKRLSTRSDNLAEKKNQTVGQKVANDETILSRHGKGQYRVHLYGLDSDEDISDMDDVDWADSNKANNISSSSVIETDTSSKTSTEARRRSAAAGHLYAQTERLKSGILARKTSWYMMITTFLSSLGTAISESVSSSSLSPLVISSAASVWTAVTAPARWLLRPVYSLAHWLITQSCTLLLWDIQAKHRKRRDCCCLLLPLLFLLPLCLLAGYYLRGVQTSSISYLSGAGQAIGSSLSYLWLTTASDHKAANGEVPLAQIPVAAQGSETSQINMTHIYQYIQQTVIQAAAAKKDDRPVGLTREQVEEIVQILLAAQLKGLNSEIYENVESLKVLLAKDDLSMIALESKLNGLQNEVKRAAAVQMAMAESFDSYKKSMDSSKSVESQEWQAAFALQQQKLLDLSEQVASLSSQNAALTALLANCCRNSTLTADIVRAQTLAILSQMGTEGNSPLADFVDKATGQFVQRSEMDAKLTALSSQIMNSLKLMLASMEKETEAKNETVVQTAIVGGVDEVTVKNIIEEALIQFSADRVGMPDFALESAGGSVLSVRCSETLYKKTALVSVFGIPLWYTSNSPRTVIQPNVNPGECWAFKGSSGYLVLQLSHPIQPTGFTLEHIPRSLSPKGDITSAPKEFTVFGLSSENDFDGVNLGNYSYLDNGKPIQFFPIQNQSQRIFQHIELRILSNHGNKEYTCIYRFRVHGLP